MEVIGSTSLAGLSPGPEVHTADEDRWRVIQAHARDARATAAVLRREAQHTRAVALLEVGQSG